MTEPAAAVVLCVNSGSSSLKSAVYRLTDGGQEQRLAAASVDGSGAAALDEALRVADPFATALTGAGHRIVHGGPRHRQPARVDQGLLADLRAAIAFAPLHLPAALDAIAAVEHRHPALAQVVCFDTAFHDTMPETAWRLALPSHLAAVGVRRYGFHGLSYEYVVDALGAGTLGRAVLAHLGNGASLAAVRDGQSVHTTMGMTPAGGIVMGTRGGDLDPGVLVYLARELGYDPDRLEQLVDHESGLRALSGGTADMQTLLRRRDAGDARAVLAFDVFCLRIRMQIGAYAALLGGLDTIVFTGGIGAHAAPVRSESCRDLEHLGVRLDADANQAVASVVSAPTSAVTVRVIETDEDVVIARHTRDVLA